ncbi:unnamed protein product [Mytilus coruscus]|uniref:Uncharacterized protein n=1 Tax=Mytilus coruscus TaxID=42192 RepID=A0A6J8BU44_MYTCO|nr:unnamed protein product [Mytilus coruscus]
MDNFTVSLKLALPDAKKRRVVVITLHTTASAERLANLKEAAVRACDAEMIYLLEQENLLNNAVYNTSCLNTYLAYRPKSTDKSAYDLAFEREFKPMDRTLIRYKKSLVMSSILINSVGKRRDDLDISIGDAVEAANNVNAELELAALKDNRRLIPVHAIVSSFDPVVTGILPFFHALSGCDSNSSLFLASVKSQYSTSSGQVRSAPLIL